MKVAVLSASPKGKNSVTYQSVRYLEKHHPEVAFEVFHVGQKIKALERDSTKFDVILDAIEACDAVLWCYPVYTFLVPYQLVRFIDLVYERGRDGAFATKYATQISTSKHFYDHTAYNYIHQISEDLGMKHLPGHCADMNDLTVKEGRARLRTFGDEVLAAVRNQAPVSTKYLPVETVTREYLPPAEIEETATAGEHRIVLVTDCQDADSNLGRMIETFRRALPNELQVLDIGAFDFQGGCLGCFHCAFEGDCIYADGFDDTHRATVLPADSIIMAAEVTRHWFNPVWKCYDDRQFYNGHRTSMMGKSVGYIVSGPLRQEANLREILEARADVAGLYLLDIVTDEYGSDEEITALLTGLAQKTMWAVEHRPQRPASFMGVGGMKVFRDLIYVMGGLMQEDHRFYKEHGLYDFPQKEVKTRLQMKLIGLLMRSPRLRKKSSKAMLDAILRPYEDAIKNS